MSLSDSGLGYRFVGIAGVGVLLLPVSPAFKVAGVGLKIDQKLPVLGSETVDLNRWFW